MATLSKGEATRKQIVEQARVILNERGIAITLEAIALDMGISKSRISNHFPTKDNLFMAILREYEAELYHTVTVLRENGFEEDLQAYIDGMSVIMDIQFKYRCGIIYLNMLSPSQHELKMHTRENFMRNQQAIKARNARLVQLNILDKAILEEPAWSGFVFAYVNMMTQWVIYYDMYDNDQPYEACKAKYLRGIFNHVYLPYLTAAGKKKLEDIRFP